MVLNTEGLSNCVSKAFGTLSKIVFNNKYKVPNVFKATLKDILIIGETFDSPEIKFRALFVSHFKYEARRSYNYIIKALEETNLSIVGISYKERIDTQKEGKGHFILMFRIDTRFYIISNENVYVLKSSTDFYEFLTTNILHIMQLFTFVNSEPLKIAEFIPKDKINDIDKYVKSV